MTTIQLFEPNENQSYVEHKKKPVAGKNHIVFHTVHKCFTDIKRIDRGFNFLKKLLDLNGDTNTIINTIMEGLDKSNATFSQAEFKPNTLLTDWAFDKGYVLKIELHPPKW
jgi:hypothetical protein